MKYNFDKIINRQQTNAMSSDGFRQYLFSDNQDLKCACPDKDLVSMWIADMDFAVAPEIIDAIKERLDNEILGYTQLSGDKYAQTFLNWTKSRYQFEFNPEHLVNSAGIVPALFDLLKYLCKADEKVLINTPSYGFFKHAADGNNLELVCSDLHNEQGNYTIDFDDFRQKASDEKVTVFILCNPHNPTGRVWREDELRQLATICFENNITIIADEIHCDLLRKGQVFTPLARLFPQSNKIITAMAASKTFNLAGLMFANLIIPNDDLRKKWQQDHFPIVNPLSLVGVQAAYEKGSPWLLALTDYLDDNFDYLNQYLAEHLPKAIFQIAESTYLAWIDISAYLDKGINLTEFFASKAGVILEGGNMFIGNADGCIRLNLACPRAKLSDGLDKVVRAIKLIK
jgi:cystathionine beta-lyase